MLTAAPQLFFLLLLFFFPRQCLLRIHNESEQLLCDRQQLFNKVLDCKMLNTNVILYDIDIDDIDELCFEIF